MSVRFVSVRLWWARSCVIALTVFLTSACSIDVPADPASDPADAGAEELEQTSAAIIRTPMPGCTIRRISGTDYAFCTTAVTYSGAISQCADMNMRPAKIASDSERNALMPYVTFPAWLGGKASGTDTNATWYWDIDRTAFFRNGAPLNGAKTYFAAGEPVAGSQCLGVDANTLTWRGLACTVQRGFVCADQCVYDPLKVAPGMCGCGVSERDGDSDGTPDCVDECPTHSAKTQPGQCGCGVSDVDTDGDKVPDCLDATPNLAGVMLNEGCGTTSAELPSFPAGTACTAVDGTPSTCDGKGHCGPAADEPLSGCRRIDIPDGGYGRIRSYWICPTARTWSQADALCRQRPGRTLVQLGSATEAALIGANIPAGVRYWTGANDQTLEGTWRWPNQTGRDGTQFWTGGADPSGKPFFSAYSKWKAGQPIASTANNCASAESGSGSMLAESCTVAYGFICEGGRTLRVREGTVRGTPITIPSTCARFNTCGTEDTTPCVDPATVFPQYTTNGDLDQARWQADAKRCADCKNQDNACVQANCTGWFTPPPAGSPTCTLKIPAAGASKASSCRIATPHLIDGTTPENPGFRYCSKNSDCASGKVCGFYSKNVGGSSTTSGRCTVTNGVVSCPSGTVDSTRDKSVIRICGVPVASCPDGSSMTGACPAGEIHLCGEASTPYELPAERPLDGLTEPTPIDPAQEFPGRRPTPAPEASEPNYRTTDTACATAGGCGYDENHSWCHYRLLDGEKVGPQDLAPNKGGSAGDSSSPVEFNITPEFRLDFQTMKPKSPSDTSVRTPGPLGYLDFGLNGSAALSSDVGFNIPIAGDLRLSGKVPLLGLKASLKVNKCGMDTGGASGTYAKLFGLDFMPIIAGDVFPMAYPEAETQLACEEQFKKFETAVNRAKKAYRDAQNLLQQYETHKRNGTNFGNICTQIVANVPKNFDSPSGACANEAPERTINRFIDFYDEEVERIYDEAKASKSANASSINGSGNMIFYDYDQTEDQTLFTVPFLVGPVPCVADLTGTLRYGFNLVGSIGVDPWPLLRESVKPGSKATRPSEIASISLTGTPYAGAGLTLFAGPGFSFAGLSVKLGIEGGVDLGQLAMPLAVRGGISVGMEKDTRAAPADLAPFVDELSPKITPRRYNVSLSYNYNMRMHIRNILRGYIGARAHASVWFFSFSYRQKILSFKGICGLDGAFDPNKLPAPDYKGTANTPRSEVWQGLGRYCDFKLFSGEGTLDDLVSIPWATISMPLPFLTLKPLTEIRALGAEKVSEVAAGDFLYDGQCQCVPRTNPPAKGTVEGQCYRSEDCCNTTDFCFANPENIDSASGKAIKECTDCRKTDLESCNVDSDCCASATLGCWDDPLTATKVKQCADLRKPTTATPGVGESCNVDSDCKDSTLGCWWNPWTRYNMCSNLRATGQACNVASDCAGFYLDPNRVSFIGCFKDPKLGKSYCATKREYLQSCNVNSDCETGYCDPTEKSCYVLVY